MTVSVVFCKGSSDKVTVRVTSPDLQDNSCSDEISSCISAKDFCVPAQLPFDRYNATERVTGLNKETHLSTMLPAKK